MGEGRTRENSSAVTVSEALAVVEGFDPGADRLAARSRELTLDLLRYSTAPFLRSQFAPGHVTCTALVLHPAEHRVLFMHHHRLHRWLLPGGHVEESDDSLAEAAAREAAEETCVRIDPACAASLAGIDVHGIPPKKGEPGEPFHLHHDLIWCFRALTEKIHITDEAPSVLWAGSADWDRLNVAESIRNSILRSESWQSI
jgi:8-oxo-dGTP pyrophosphatase MutT (NUDIX family)